MKNIYSLFIIVVVSFIINAKIAFGSEPSVVFINPGKTGEVFWDMVSDFMQQAGEQLNIDLTIYTAERDHIKMTQLAQKVANSANTPDYMILVNEKGFVSRVLPNIPESIKIILLNNGLSKEEQKNMESREKFFQTG